jgi:DNA topoisomerase I
VADETEIVAMHIHPCNCRYTEASFVKELESQGVGRPSTYASILETLKKRYVQVRTYNPDTMNTYI